MGGPAPETRLHIHFRTLLPFFLLAGALLNLAITTPPRLQLGRVSGLALRAERTASYGRDVPGLSFPALDPAIVDQTRKDAGRSGSDPLPPAQPSPGATATPPPPPGEDGLRGLPTLAIELDLELDLDLDLLPTVVGVVPTVVGVVPTVVGVVPTVVDVVPTVVSIVPTLLPVVPTLVAPILPGLFP